jgi:hypothetical protein
MDPESSVFINGLTDQWIQYLNRLLVVSGTVERGVCLKDVGHWRPAFERGLALSLPVTPPSASYLQVV